ncbi:retrovirus-related pol polyprotein from transposon TNT 1-94 [Tanacetum coccineum]
MFLKLLNSNNSNELELLYSPMFSELLNGTSHVVSKSSTVHAADNPDKRQQQNTTHTSTTTDVADPPPLNTHSTHQTPTQGYFGHFALHQPPHYCTRLPRTDATVPRTDTRQCHVSPSDWSSRHLNSTDVYVNTSDNYRSAWIESMQEELHQFDRLDVWELVDRPLYKNVINLKWLWKNKRDKENTVIHNKSRLMAKGYAQKEGIDFEESFVPLA